MDISYIGHSSFLIKSKTAKIVTDPFDPKFTGLKFPKISADIVTISHDHKDHNFKEGVDGSPFVLTWPGEYEKNQIRITGYPSFHDKVQGQNRGENIMFKFEDEDVSVLHCGDLGHELNDETIDLLGSVDIVLVPVGGVNTIELSIVRKILNEIEPHYVIPMHFDCPELDKTNFKELQSLGIFLKEFGATNITSVDKFTFKRDLVSEDGMQVVLMNMNYGRSI